MPRDEHFAPIYKWRLLSNFRSTVGYLVSGFTPSMARFVHNDISARKFAECLYCDVSPPPSYLSCLVSSSSPVTYSHTNHIHTFIHPYINTFIYSYIHTFMRTHHIHNIYSYMVASVAHSLVWSHPFNSVLNCFKWLVLNNGQLEFTFVFLSNG